MKRRFEIVVMFKEGLLDPQGKAVQDTLPTMGWEGISEVRIGKHVELTIEAASEGDARRTAEEVGRRLLSNPVIEDIRVIDIEGAAR